MRRIIIIFCSFDYFCIDNFRCCVWSGLDVSIWYLTFFCILIFDDIALNSETLFCTNNFLSVCCGWLAGFTDNWFGCTLTTAKVTRLRKIQGYTGLCQKNLKSKVTRFQKFRGYTAGFASRFSKVTMLQKLRKLHMAMPEDSQRLQGFRSYEVTQPALPADFQRLQGYRVYESYTGLCQKILKGYKVSEVMRLHSRLCQQIFKGYRVAEVAKDAQGYARRFSKVTRFQKLRGCAELWLEILKGCRVAEVAGCAGLYHPPPLKLQGCRGCRGCGGLCQINSKDIHQVST